MNAELIIAAGAFLLVYLASLGGLAHVCMAQNRELSRLAGAIVHNQLADMALEASKETKTMVGPAVLQQLKEPIKMPLEVVPKEKKETGVTLKY